MPFEKGNQLGKGEGRKGYEFEKKQLEKMRELVDKDLKLFEKLYEGKLEKKQIESLQIAQSRILKILDKLHASKQSIGGDEENPLKVVILPEAVSKSFNIYATDGKTEGSNPEQSEI